MSILRILGIILLLLAAIFFFAKIATEFLLLMVIIGVLCIVAGSINLSTGI